MSSFRLVYVFVYRQMSSPQLSVALGSTEISPSWHFQLASQQFKCKPLGYEAHKPCWFEKATLAWEIVGFVRRKLNGNAIGLDKAVLNRALSTWSFIPREERIRYKLYLVAWAEWLDSAEPFGAYDISLPWKGCWFEAEWLLAVCEK